LFVETCQFAIKTNPVYPSVDAFYNKIITDRMLTWEKEKLEYKNWKNFVVNLE